MLKPDPWYRIHTNLEQFILGMLTLGTPIETLLVGAFNKEGRGAQRDMELDFHRDGEYSDKLAKRQGMYVEAKNIDIVGFFCITPNVGCKTHIRIDGDDNVHTLLLGKSDALVFDNRRVQHARTGDVGARLLFRIWLKEFNT
jgi:hypothetical protein